MALFQHEDFIILGMLFAKYFKGNIIKHGNGQFGGGSWTGGGGGYIPGGYTGEYGTGRGGIITADSAGDGDNGRPGASDNITGTADPSLAGAKGMTTGGGRGLHNGQFGYGGPANDSGIGINNSAGGGGGWYGGGSSYVCAGGGGGSNYVYANNKYSKECQESVRVETGRDLPVCPYIEPGKWYGIDIIPSVKNDTLLLTNTRHIQEYEGLKGTLGGAYSKFIQLHERANGNGLCIISKPNTTINVTDDDIDNIMEIFEFTGSVQEWTPPVEGDYQFILWGAQGGTWVYTPRGLQGLEYQQYTGGFGGAVSAIFHLSPSVWEIDEQGIAQMVDTVLTISVGEEGKTIKFRDAFGGGGNAGGQNSGGGGATDIRWGTAISWERGIWYRLAVAGGGGGCMGPAGGDSIEGPFEGGNTGDVETGGEDGEIDLIPEDEQDPWFLVNDLSLVYVTINYYTLTYLPVIYKMLCTLYISQGREGTLTQDFKIHNVGGTVEICFPLDQIYPPNTETHWVQLSAKVLTDILFIIPNNGVTIRVETRQRPNESDNNLKKAKPVYFSYIDYIKLTDIYKVTLKAPPEPIHLSYIDKFGLIDFANVALKVISYMHISEMERLGLKDIYNVEFKSYGPKEDIYISGVDKLHLIDLIKIQIKKQRDEYIKDIIDKTKLNDLHRVSFKKVKILHLSYVDKLHLTDMEDIHNE